MIAGNEVPGPACLYLPVSYISVEAEDTFRNKYNFQLTSYVPNALLVLIQKENYD